MLRLVGPSEKSLAELLYQQQQLGEPIPVPLTLSILRQVCEALDWAHNLRDPNGQFLYVLHRDINPAVIFVGANGATRLVASTAAQANCGYVAPEALVGMNPDPRSDIFSLGVVAHEMLTNRPLFHGYNDHDTLARVCSLPIPLPSTINPAVTPDIEGLVLMALTRDPAYRWQSAAMLRDGLVSVAQRNGLEVVAGMEHAWADLIAGRRSVKPEPVLPSVQFSSPPALPQQQPVVPLPPPKDEQWTDDTNMETRIQPADPRIADEQPLDPRGPTAIQDVAAPVSNATASTVVANPERPPQHSVEDPTRALRPADRSPAGGLPSPRASQAPGNLANPSAAKTPRPELAPSKTPRPEPVRPAGPNIANTPRPSPDPAPLPDPSTRPAQPNLANPSARPSQMPASTKLPARPFAIPDIPRPPTPPPTVERPEPAADDSGELPVQIDDSEFAGETRADAAAYVDPEGAGSRAQTAADEHPAEAAELPYSPTLPTDDDPLAQAGSESTDDPDDPVAEPPRPSSPNMFSETPGAATQPSIDALAEPPRKQAAVKRADDDDPLFADLPAPRKQARKPDDDPLADLPSPRKRPADRKPVEDPFADLPSPRRKPDAEPQQASSLFEDLPAPRAASGPTNLPAPRGQRADDRAQLVRALCVRTSAIAGRTASERATRNGRRRTGRIRPAQTTTQPSRRRLGHRLRPYLYANGP